MKPWETLSRAKAPDGTELILQRRGDELVIRAGGHVLMGSRAHGSEEAMARAGLGSAPRKGGPGFRWLVGGLGMGFTLRAVLDVLPASARVVVAELIPAVVAWNREVLASLARAPLADARVEVREEDVVRLLMRAPPGEYDAVLLDVDNGPSALTAKGNGALYSTRGIGILRQALRPGGRLVVWSAARDPAFLRRLGEGGFQASAQDVGREILFVGVRE